MTEKYIEPMPPSPVAVTDLVVGQGYFDLYYLGSDALWPIMETMVYLGKGI